MAHQTDSPAQSLHQRVDRTTGLKPGVLIQLSAESRLAGDLRGLQSATVRTGDQALNTDATADDRAGPRAVRARSG